MLPCAVVEDERCADLSPSARAVYDSLWYVVHRVSSPRFCVKEVVLQRVVKRDPKTMRTAVKELVNRRLLTRVARRPGVALSEYWLHNPSTGFPLPEDEGKPTPTFNGFSKRRQSAKAMLPVKRSKKSAGKETHESATEKELSLTALQSVKETARSEAICYIRGHSLTHYRKDGYPLCGICHLTGITEPPSSSVPVPLGSVEDKFKPPTAKEIGF